MRKHLYLSGGDNAGEEVIQCGFRRTKSGEDILRGIWSAFQIETDQLVKRREKLAAMLLRRLDDCPTQSGMGGCGIRAIVVASSDRTQTMVVSDR